MTDTQLTPAAGSISPPGTLSRKVKATAVPMGVVSSNAARLRSNSNRPRAFCRSLSESGEPWKACWSTTWKSSNSSGPIGRIGYGLPAPLRADSVIPAFVPRPARQREWFSSAARIGYSAPIMVSAPPPTVPAPKGPAHPPTARPGAGRRRVLRAFRSLQSQLTRQFITRNRRMAFVLSAATIAIAIAAVHLSEWWFSPGVMILPILAGGLLLWPRALRIYFGFAAVALIYDVVDGRAGAGIIATIVLTALFADVLARTREKLGVQGLRGDRMLLELRDRIRAQGKLPELGEGWGSSLVLKPAGGSSFGGDFVVSYSDGKILEVALVDVSGKGIDAGTRALLLSGAFGGLLGSVPRDEFLPACNAYMRRGGTSEGFVTAVHLSLDLASGEYVISSAGHPPAVPSDAAAGRWRLTKAHGIVLGVVPDLRGAAAETA